MTRTPGSARGAAGNGGPYRHPRYTEAELRVFVPTATNLTEVLRHFGLRPAGGNFRLLKRWPAEWGISTEHFVGTPPPVHKERTPLEAVLVAGSTYPRGQLKRRLYEEGLKRRLCELCGQWAREPEDRRR